MAPERTLKWLSTGLHRDAGQFYVTVKWLCKTLNFVVGSLVPKFVVYLVLSY